MHIVLYSRPDRMGSNLSWYIMQLVYAHYVGCHIYYIHVKYDNSLFVKALLKYIDKHNELLREKDVPYEPCFHLIEESEQDWPGNNMKVCKAIECDLYSYFKKHLYQPIREIMNGLAIEKNYFSNLDFDPEKTICVHLRLDDVINRFDYEGIFSTKYYREKLNNGNINIDLEEEREFMENQGIRIRGWGRTYNPYDCQAPIAENRIQEIINQAKDKYPDHEIVIVASPSGNEIGLPYRCIRSEDPDFDLFMLCNCNVLICSRSLFCFSSTYLGTATDIYIPMWGHITGTGLTTKYDQANLNYWY